MSRAHWIAVAAAMLVGGCIQDSGLLAPGADDVHPAMAVTPGPTAVSGDFAATVDFSTVTFTPRGENCLLEISGQLVFSGDIVGAAVGTTSALVFASCEDVATTPPGTFRDVFRSELQFEGTVGGEQAEGSVMYQGGVQPGGQLEGRLLWSNGISGVLDVDAVVAVGGTYEGSLVVH
jgi:hypothetical protein